MSKKFIVIDCNSVLHRAYHALPPLLSNGVNTGGVYGFMSMLTKVIKDYKPDYVAGCFDHAKKVFRHEFYEDYKAGRKKTDPELVEQFPIMKEFFKSMDIPVLEKQGYEADDIIGSVCSKFNDVDTYVLTGDKDSLQLIDKNTFVLLMKKGISDIDLYNDDEFFNRYGIKPNQFVDVKALMGDKSDNIPGVTKVGEKTALRLICDYGSLDGVYNNLDKEKGKLKENLTNEKDMAYLSQKLAKIDCEMDIDYALEDFAFDYEDIKKSYPLLEKYNMKSIIKRTGNSASENKVLKEKPVFKKISKPIIINSEKDLEDNISSLAPVPLCLAILEDGIYFSDGQRNCKAGQQLSLFDETIERSKVIKLLFKHISKYGVITDDAKNLYGIMDEYNLEGEIVFDISLMAYLIDSSKKDYSISALIVEYFGEKNLCGLAMFYLYEHLKVLGKEFYDICNNIELPLSRVLYSMEKQGFEIDVNSLRELSVEFRSKMVSLEKEIFEISGETFNINSPKQLAVVLFDKMGLKRGKKTKTGYSTDVETMEKIREQSPIIDKILEYRKFAKLMGTYIDGFIPLVGNDGRVHCEFLQKGTVTGRIASKEPNLQNIPIRTESGRNRIIFL